MNNFKTKAGTELQLMNLKGKSYLAVAQRLIWFREERPLWGIETSYLKIEEEFSIARAEIKDETGRIIATATKREDARHFADHMEKCETGAIGRALALCGFGTQFAEELDEGERIVDSPQPRPALTTRQHNDARVAQLNAAKPAELGAFVMPIGKNQGKRLNEIEVYQLNSWLDFMSKADNPSARAVEAMNAVEAFLNQRDRSMQAKG